MSKIEVGDTVNWISEGYKNITVVFVQDDSVVVDTFEDCLWVALSTDLDIVKKHKTKSAVQYMAQSEGLPDMITFFDEQKKTPTPERYTSRLVHGMDVIELVKHWGLNFNEGNILKYLIRDKGEDISDMQKIGVYANRELKHLKDEN